MTLKPFDPAARASEFERSVLDAAILAPLENIAAAAAGSYDVLRYMADPVTKTLTSAIFETNGVEVYRANLGELADEVRGFAQFDYFLRALTHPAYITRMQNRNVASTTF